MKKVKFHRDDVVKLVKGFESFPLSYGVISLRNRKYLPYFAYGNKPNITSTYRVIEYHKSRDIVVIQNVGTEQVYIVRGDSLKHKYVPAGGVCEVL